MRGNQRVLASRNTCMKSMPSGLWSEPGNQGSITRVAEASSLLVCLPPAVPGTSLVTQGGEGICPCIPILLELVQH